MLERNCEKRKAVAAVSFCAKTNKQTNKQNNTKQKKKKTNSGHFYNVAQCRLLFQYIGLDKPLKKQYREITVIFPIATGSGPLELENKFLSIDWRNYPRSQDFLDVCEKDLVCSDVLFVFSVGTCLSSAT